MSSLFELCFNIIIDKIIKLPYLLQEQIIGYKLNHVDIENVIIKEIRDSGIIIIDDITDKLVLCYNSKTEFIRPEYTKDLNDNLYNCFLDISKKFLDKYYWNENQYSNVCNFKENNISGNFKNIVADIENLPPTLKEYIIENSIKHINRNIENNIIKDIRESALFIIDDITDKLIDCYSLGTFYNRPEYTKNLDGQLYYTFIGMAEKLLDKYYSRERRYYNDEIDNTRYSDMEYTEEEEEEEEEEDEEEEEEEDENN